MKVKSYTPLWLSQQPGRAVFTPSSSEPQPSLSSSIAHPSSFSPRRSTGVGGRGNVAAAGGTPGPRRTVAHRGTEIFVAVGREIRWADLVQLRESWSAPSTSRRQSMVHGGSIKREQSDTAAEQLENGAAASAYKAIKAPVADEIRQLVMSPFADFLAVLTTHTCHILVLPDSSHLSSSTSGALRPRFFTLGSSIHVTSRAPIVSALWHPLGVNGSCLVTVTDDSVVRTWELSPQNRWSFERPTQSIDLRKLADGDYLEQDFSGSSTAVTPGAKVFSPDSIEMRCAAACFPARGTGCWAPMTLWVAMREGDVYALCPLLPERWAPPPTLIPSLSVAVVANLAAVEDSDDAARRRLAQQQFDWMSDLDSQEPTILPSHPGEPPTEVYARPQRPGAVPRLQGPFSIPLVRESENDLDNQLADILVIGQRSDTDDLMDGEEMDLVADSDREGLSLSVVCLLSISGQVRVCLDVRGVEAEWLPSRKPKFHSAPHHQTYEAPSLLAFQSLDVLTEPEACPEGCPMFSEDLSSRYAFYVTHGTSITYVSLASWATLLERELQNQSEAGVDFRLDLLAKGRHHERERVYTRENQVDGYVPLAACQAIRDPDLGYLLLSATPYEPIAIMVEPPEEAFEIARHHHAESQEPEEEEEEEEEEDADDGVGQTPQSIVFEPRPVFEPPNVLSRRSALPDLLERLRTSRHKTMIHSEIRLSPATLSTFTDAHQILSEETHKLGTVAAELFRRSDQLCAELRGQVETVQRLRDRIAVVADGDQEEGGENGIGSGERAAARLAARVSQAQERQRRLVERLDAMKQRTSRAPGTTRELSAQETAWIQECHAAERSVLAPAEGQRDEVAATSGAAKKPPYQRLADVRSLTAELIAEARALAERQAGDLAAPADGRAHAAPVDLKIPSALRRKKVEEVRSLLDRESALVNAVVERLQRLTTAG